MSTSQTHGDTPSPGATDGVFTASTLPNLETPPSSPLPPHLGLDGNSMSLFWKQDGMDVDGGFGLEVAGEGGFLEF
jgi:hypothetical protein